MPGQFNSPFPEDRLPARGEVSTASSWITLSALLFACENAEEMVEWLGSLPSDPDHVGPEYEFDGWDVEHMRHDLAHTIHHIRRAIYRREMRNAAIRGDN